MYDVIVVGGGPAGLSAALVLGRCRRSVLVCDDGAYRNAASHSLHGFLSRDCIDPADLRRIGREQLGRYGVELREAHVTSARGCEGRFELTLRDDEVLQCRRLLLATGVVDRIPAIDGFDRYYGRSVFHCPYCDGWEHQEQRLAVYGRGVNGLGLALSLKTWSSDVVLCTDGQTGLDSGDLESLAAAGIAVRPNRILRLDGPEEAMERIVFKDGSSLPRQAVFLSTGQYQRSELASVLGCAFTRKGTVRTGKLERTNVPGLFVAGDASRDVQLAVVAAAEGAKAAIAINKSLAEEGKFRL
jgi:thioredoxin reductase